MNTASPVLFVFFLALNTHDKLELLVLFSLVLNSLTVAFYATVAVVSIFVRQFNLDSSVISIIV